MVIVKRSTPTKCKFADGVNIVSRIESEAGAGQIFISSDVFSVTFGKLDCDYKDVGNRDLKNVD
ncbi:MAG TPA: hypothetical protein EYG11_16425 [Candidatus Latescibacteria bacterium]|nr:hypothetical protein [Candidatus Handelsmanbacteria bacterium]HIL10287.1 hypothetical protein [Candidatus Latescibacterota bacterium]